MKKLILMAALAVFALTNVNAQDLSFGAKAGLNLASLNGDGADNVDGRTSFHFGGVVNIGLGEMFAIQPELIYSAQGATQDLDLGILGTVETTTRLDYLNIPIMADVTIAEGLSLQGGPQVGINVTGEVESNGETQDINDVETLDLGVVLEPNIDYLLVFSSRLDMSSD